MGKQSGHFTILVNEYGGVSCGGKRHGIPIKNFQAIGVIDPTFLYLPRFARLVSSSAALTRLAFSVGGSSSCWRCASSSLRCFCAPVSTGRQQRSPPGRFNFFCCLSNSASSSKDLDQPLEEGRHTQNPRRRDDRSITPCLSARQVDSCSVRPNHLNISRGMLPPFPAATTTTHRRLRRRLSVIAPTLFR